MELLYIIPFVLLLGVYCYFEYRNNFKIATSLKVILSFYIAVMSWIFAFQNESNYLYLVAIGLTFAVPADFFLQYIKSNSKLYTCGIISFGLMHISLIISFFLIYKFQYQEYIILVILLLTLTLFQTKERWKLGKEKIELTVYTVLVTFMASKAMSNSLVDFSNATLILGLGGLFFFISDLFLGIWDYYQNKFIFLLLNRVVYFTGQILIAYYVYLAVL